MNTMNTINQLSWCLVNTYKDTPKNIIENIISDSFSEWSKYINVTFTKECGDTNGTSQQPNGLQPNITIGFYSKNHNDEEAFDGLSGVLAHTTTPLNPGTKDGMNDLFIHFDADESWYFHKPHFFDYFTKNVYFKNVAVHEIGHVLGLKHSVYYNSIMYPNYSTLDVLSTNDVKNIQKIYDAKINTPLPRDVNSLILLFQAHLPEISLFVIIMILFYKMK